MRSSRPTFELSPLSGGVALVTFVGSTYRRGDRKPNFSRSGQSEAFRTDHGRRTDATAIGLGGRLVPAQRPPGE